MANVGRCNLRGVLKTTPPKWAQSVSYHMAVENSTLFSLTIGDSLINNAWGKGRWEGGSKEGWGGRRATGREEGRRREGSRGWREQGRERGCKGREVGSNGAGQAESVSGGKEG